MKPNRPIIHLTNAVLLCAPLVSMAQQPPCLDKSPYEKTEIKHGWVKATVPSVYFLNRSPTPTYSDDTTTQVAKQSNEALGTPFLAVNGQKTEQRVKLGRYDHQQQCFIELLGWVNQSHLLHSLKPLRVGEVVKRFPQLKDQTIADSSADSQTVQQQMSETNRLFLRVLSRPEYRSEPATAPGQSQQQASASEIKIGHLGHLWRYVYAVEEIDQQLWYLVGSKSQLTYRVYIPKIYDTITKEVQQGLLGWVARRQVSEWPSNVVLEPNTQEGAVWERYDDNKDNGIATIFQKADETSPIMAQENQELWKSAIDGQVNDQTPARFAPFGLAPDIARYFVKGYDPKTGWYHVASVGAIRPTATQHSSTLLLHQAAIEAIKDQLGIDSSVFSALASLAFVEGYTRRRVPRHHYDTYREMALIEKRELLDLYDQANSFLYAFDYILNSGRNSEAMGEVALLYIIAELSCNYTLLDKLDDMTMAERHQYARRWIDRRQVKNQYLAELIGLLDNSKVMVAVALLYAIAELSGNDRLLDDLEDMTVAERRKYALLWLNNRKVKNRSLAELIGLQDSLPIPSEGMLGMTPMEIKRLPLERILVERDQLALKIVCLKKILDGQTVPLDISQCRTHKGQIKNWLYTPAGSSNTYIYLPMYLVP